MIIIQIALGVLFGGFLLFIGSIALHLLLDYLLDKLRDYYDEVQKREYYGEKKP